MGLRGGSGTRPVWEKKLAIRDSPRDPHLHPSAWESDDYPTQEEWDYACPEGEAICTTEQYRQWLNAHSNRAASPTGVLPHARER